MCPEGDFDFAPGQQDIGMVSLRLSNVANPIDKFQSLLEIGECKRARDVVLVDDLPMRPLW